MAKKKGYIPGPISGTPMIGSLLVNYKGALSGGFVDPTVYHQDQQQTTPEIVIRSMLPLDQNAPRAVVADYLEDHQMYQMAQYMRGLCSGG